MIATRLARFVVSRPRHVLLATLLLALFALPLVLRLRLDTEMVDLLPHRSDEVQTFTRFTHLFGSEDVLIALVECDNPAQLGAFSELWAERLAARPDVASVRVRLSADSARLLRDHLVDLLDDEEQDELVRRATPAALLARVRRLRAMLAAPGGSALSPLVTADPLELLSLVGPRLQAGLPIDPKSGYYRSPDGKAQLLFIAPRFGAFDIEADRRLIEGASAAARELGARIGLPEADSADSADSVDSPRLKPAANGTGAQRAVPVVDYTGSYAYALTFRDWLHRDMQISTAVSASAVLLFFALLLGAVRALPLVALPLFVGLHFTAACAVLLYGRVNAVSLAFGTLLLSIGIDLPIQLYNRLREELATHPPHAALERTIAELAGPALLATLGPTVVFLACAWSEYRGLAELGVLAAFGLGINFIVMMTVLPSLLSLVPARLWVPRRAWTQAAGGRGFALIGRLASKRPWLMLGGVLLVTLGLLPSVGRVRFERRIISIEPAAMPPARVRREIDHRFGGREARLIMLSDGASDEAARLASDRVRARAETMRRAGLLASYESLSSLFPSSTEVARRRERLTRALNGPPRSPIVGSGEVSGDGPGESTSGTARLARDLRAALVEAGFDESYFAPFLAQLEHPPPPLRPEDAGPELAFVLRAQLKHDGARTVVATYFNPAAGRVEAALVEARRIAAAWPEDGRLTGQPILETALHDVVVRDTRRVTALSVVAVIVLLVLYYRRARPTLAVLLPLAVAWVLFAAVLGALDLPLNLFNLLTVPLVVGYGIDDHVFLVHRHEAARALDPNAGPATALASTGRAIVVTSLSTMAGFGGLAVARFDGLRQLGLAGAIAVGLCLVAAFAVLPALLTIFDRLDTRARGPR